MTSTRTNLWQKNRWSEEYENLVERLWKEGKSANAIGKQIGKSRNSVIGKIHRMRLQNSVRMAAAPVRNIFNPGFGPPKPKTEVPGLKLKAVQKVREAALTVVASNPAPKPADPPEAAAAPSVGLLEISYGRHCAYPVAGSGADTRYCGHTTQGKTYCPSHRAIMYEKKNSSLVPRRK